MNEDKLEFHRRYGGDEKQRIEELEKEIAAYDDMNAVRVKYDLALNCDQDAHIRIQLQKLEENGIRRLHHRDQEAVGVR